MKTIANASQSLKRRIRNATSVLTNNLDTSKEKYLKKVIEGKTAGLFSAASVLGGIITKQKQVTLKLFKFISII